MEHLIVNGGEEYLGFARGRIKAMRSVTLVPYASQQFNLGTALIRLSIEPGHEYIRIDDSPAVYQFFSTGPTLQTLTVPETKAFVISKGYSFSVSKNLKKSALPKDNFKAKVHGSSVEAGPLNAERKPKWPLLEMFGPFEKSFPVKENFQIEGITEYVYFPAGSSGKINGKNKLMNSWSCSKQIEGLLSNSGAYYTQYDDTGSSFTWTSDIYVTGISSFDVDVNYDLSPGVGKGRYVVPDADWYKRAAIKTVTHKKYGTRKFIILTDISGVFHAYPVAVDTDMPLDEASAAAAMLYVEQAIKTNMNSNFDRKIDTPYPDWCRKNIGASSRQATLDGDESNKTIQRVPQYRWAFNSDASKACAVVYEDLKLGLNESHVDSPNKLDNKSFTFESYKLGKLPLYESLPGLLELDIHIELLGPKLNEFEFTIAVAQEMQPTLTGKYIVGADYAWPIKDHTDKDDLILMTGSVYHTSLVREQVPLIFNLKVNKTIIDIENFTADKIVRSFLVRASNQSYSIDGRNSGGYYHEDKLFLDESLSAIKSAEAIFLAVDLRVLAFVVRQKYKVKQVDRTVIVNRQQIYAALASDAESAVRVQTYMRNKLEDEIILENSTLDAELDSFFSNDSVQSMFKMPITERGGLYTANTDVPAVNGHSPLNGYASIHWLGGIYRNPYAEYDTYSKTVRPSFGDTTYTAFRRTYDVGALAYAFFVTSVLHQSHSSIFSVHPDGGWSIVTQPITYFSGPAAINETYSDLALDRMRSTLVDIVSFRLPATAAQTKAGEFGEEARTTHLELINKALDRTYTLKDFLPKFELRTWTHSYYLDTFLGAPAHFTKFTDTYLVDSGSEKSIFVGSTDTTSLIFSPNLWDFQTGNTTYWAFVIGDKTDKRVNKPPVLGGSAMFI